MEDNRKSYLTKSSSSNHFQHLKVVSVQPHVLHCGGERLHWGDNRYSITILLLIHTLNDDNNDDDNNDEGDDGMMKVMMTIMMMMLYYPPSTDAVQTVCVVNVCIYKSLEFFPSSAVRSSNCVNLSVCHNQAVDQEVRQSYANR